MSTPSDYDLFSAAMWTYEHDQNPPFPAFEANGQPMRSLIVATGFFGAALQTPSGDIIIAFEGTDHGSIRTEPEFVTAQIVADYLIYRGDVPPAFTDALSFTKSVVREAAGRNIPLEDIFVTGHSLGGGEAQYVAAHFGLDGATFGGPGIALSAIPPHMPSQLTNYVERGDPVGNYSATPLPPVEGAFLFSDQIVRYGEPTYIGSFLGLAELEFAVSFFEPGRSDEDEAIGLGLLAEALAEYHVADTYSMDLFGVPAPFGLDDEDWTAEEVIAAYSAVWPTPGSPAHRAVLTTALNPTSGEKAQLMAVSELPVSAGSDSGLFWF